MKERIPLILNSLSNFFMPIDACWLSLDACSVYIITYVELINFRLSMCIIKEQPCTFLFKQNCWFFDLCGVKPWLFPLYIFSPIFIIAVQFHQNCLAVAEWK